jgi:predicted metal-dependent phosphoesterase TrpH
MGLADPHCHTRASDGMVTPRELVAAARAAGIDLIAVCDHDTMAAAAETVACGEEAGVAVVPGQEITTRWPAQTHIVGWYLQKPVRMGMSIEDTIDAIRDQGGLAVVPHPFMPTFFASIQPAMLARLIERRRLDAIEVIHPSPTTPGRRRALVSFYEAHREQLGAAVAGSDSHFGAHDLGRALTEFEGTNVRDFRRAVEAAATRPKTGVKRRVPAGLAARQQVRSLLELPLRRLRGEFE